MIDTRQRLLNAALRCIASEGLASTTSRDIAREAGANLAAITYHFGSKDQLVTEALLDALRSWLAPTLEALTSGRDAPERTLLAVQTLLGSFEEHADAAPAFVQALAEAPHMESLQSGVVGLWTELRTLLGTHMNEMQRAGQLPPWVDPDAMSSVLLAVANGLVLQVVVDPSGPTMGAMATQFAALLLSAGQAPSDSEGLRRRNR